MRRHGDQPGRIDVGASSGISAWLTWYYDVGEVAGHGLEDTDGSNGVSIIGFHRFLIGTAILFCALFAAWETSLFLNSGDWLSVTLAVTFGVATVALVYYLANLDRFLDRRQPH